MLRVAAQRIYRGGCSRCKNVHMCVCEVQLYLPFSKKLFLNRSIVPFECHVHGGDEPMAIMRSPQLDAFVGEIMFDEIIGESRISSRIEFGE